MLHEKLIETPCGTIIAIADEQALYLLEFAERKGLNREIEQLKVIIGAEITPGYNHPIKQIEQELQAYFAGTLQEFKTPLALTGTPFQKMVWQALVKIPFGTTISYAELATTVGNPVAYRAVARANSMNKMPLIIPCHRVINSGGKLGGYAGGLPRKEWLLQHEAKFAPVHKQKNNSIFSQTSL